MRRYSLRVPAGEADLALVRMLDWFPAGVEQQDDGDHVVISGYAESPPAAGLGEQEVPAGWEDAWREFHHPVRQGRIWVAPPWRADAAPDDCLAVIIDPGRAFGTGGHGSTRAALELLQRLPPSPALDLGCGSGVLSIAAAKLGFAPVLAVDLDETALEVTKVNAAANGVVVDVGTEQAPAELAVMNIALDVVQRLLPGLAVRRAITSGYLDRDEPRAAAWHSVERRVRDGWAADLLELRP
jgi:ribosomal protein L11 methyltransferase